MWLRLYWLLRTLQLHPNWASTASLSNSNNPARPANTACRLYPLAESPWKPPPRTFRSFYPLVCPVWPACLYPTVCLRSVNTRWMCESRRLSGPSLARQAVHPKPQPPLHRRPAWRLRPFRLDLRLRPIFRPAHLLPNPIWLVTIRWRNDRLLVIRSVRKTDRLRHLNLAANSSFRPIITRKPCWKRPLCSKAYSLASTWPSWPPRQPKMWNIKRMVSETELVPMPTDNRIQPNKQQHSEDCRTHTVSLCWWARGFVLEICHLSTRASTTRDSSAVQDALLAQRNNSSASSAIANSPNPTTYSSTNALTPTNGRTPATFAAKLSAVKTISVTTGKTLIPLTTRHWLSLL